jgi:hypothetical protein
MRPFDESWQKRPVVWRTRGVDATTERFEIAVVEGEQETAPQCPRGLGKPFLQLQAGLEAVASVEAGSSPARGIRQRILRERAQDLDKPIALRIDINLPGTPTTGDFEDVDGEAVQDFIGDDAALHWRPLPKGRRPLGPLGGMAEPATLPGSHPFELLHESPSQGASQRAGRFHGACGQIAQPCTHLDDPEGVRAAELLPDATQRLGDQAAEPGADGWGRAVISPVARDAGRVVAPPVHAERGAQPRPAHLIS